MKKKLLSVLLLPFLVSCSDYNAGKSVGSASTKFNLIGKNDRIELESFVDNRLKGITCFISYAKKGGVGEWVNTEEDNSDASLSCVFNGKTIEYVETMMPDKELVYKRNSSMVIKTMQVVRYYDKESRSFIYMVYSDKILDGSPKNAIASVSCYELPEKSCVVF